jgi:hypothetical protein
MHRTEKFVRLHPCREPSSAGLIPSGVSWFGREAEANRERGVAALPFRIMTLLTSKSLHNSYGTPVPLHSSCETNSPQNVIYFGPPHYTEKMKNVNTLTFNCKTLTPSATSRRIGIVRDIRERVKYVTWSIEERKFCKPSLIEEEPAAGAIAKTAVLRSPPAPIALTALTPEELPDGWSGSAATALSLQTAISAKVAPPGVILPWSTVCKAINLIPAVGAE